MDHARRTRRRATRHGDDFEALRRTVVYAQSELLELADAPIETPVCGGETDLIELNGFYEDLEAGRWVIVSGERDLPTTKGVRFSELSMLASVTHSVGLLPKPTSIDGPVEDQPRPGETTHTLHQAPQDARLLLQARHGADLRQRRRGDSRRNAHGNRSGAAPAASRSSSSLSSSRR